MHFYYEIHITLEPEYDSALEMLKRIAGEYQFHVSDFLMYKNEKEPKAFCSARTEQEREAFTKTIEFVSRLKKIGFKPIRYKIERCDIDSRYEDTFALLKGGDA